MSRLLLMFSLVVIGTGAGVAADLNASAYQASKAAKGTLKGDWILVSNESIGIVAEIFGQVPEPDKIRMITCTEKQMTLRIDGESTVIGPYRLDSTKTPKALDLTIDIRGGKKATLQGIYALEGDHLKISFDSFGEGRPAKFPLPTKVAGEKRFGRPAVLVFRRIGANPKLDVLAKNHAKCADNLATLARVMHDHVSELRAYPVAAISSKDGKALLSWRVALLGRLDEGDLLKEFKTEEPWNSVHNKKLIPKMPKIYAMPGVETIQPGMTFFQVFTGKGTVFEGKVGLKFNDQLRRDRQFMIVEAGEPVIWTRPDDLAYDAGKALPRLGRSSTEGFLAAMTFPGDRIVFFPKTTPEHELRSLIQGREPEAKGKQEKKKPN